MIVIEILAFLGLVTVSMILAYYINHHKYGEVLSLYPRDSMTFLIRDHQNNVNQIKILIFLTIINKGMKKIEITDISLNLIADKVQIPFILATKSELLIAEEISQRFPLSINNNERYDKILSFTTGESLRDELKPIIITMNGIETKVSSKYVIKLTVKCGTRKERNFYLKLNLDENTIANLPEIAKNRVILPIEMFNILWEINNRQKNSPRKFYRW